MERSIEDNSWGCKESVDNRATLSLSLFKINHIFTHRKKIFMKEYKGKTIILIKLFLIHVNYLIQRISSQQP